MTTITNIKYGWSKPHRAAPDAYTVWNRRIGRAAFWMIGLYLAGAIIRLNYVQHNFWWQS